MRFLLEKAPTRASHPTCAPAVDHPASLADRQVLAIAHREERILITDDRDFGELIVAGKLPHAGVIYLRLGAYADLQTRIDRMNYALTHHAAQFDRFLVVARLRVRIGGVPSTASDVASG